MWISQSEAARKVKVTKQRINALVAQGRLTVNEKKQVESDDVLRHFAKESDPAWDEQAGQANAAADCPAATQAASDDDDSPSFREAKTKQTLLAIEKQEFELNKQRGLYLLRSDVERAQEAAARKMRQQLDTVPHMADELFAASRDGSAADLRRLLKVKVHQFLTIWAAEMNAAATQGADADGA